MIDGSKKIYDYHERMQLINKIHASCVNVINARDLKTFLLLCSDYTIATVKRKLNLLKDNGFDSFIYIKYESHKNSMYPSITCKTKNNHIIKLK